MSISFNPGAVFHQIINHDSLRILNDARDTVRDTVRNDVVSTWNKLPGNERVESAVGRVADSLPFNNVAEAGVRALAGEKQIMLDKDATDGIQRDPAFVKAESDIVTRVETHAQQNENYGKTAFDIPLSDLYPETNGKIPLELGGQRGNMAMGDQLRHFYEVNNPEIRKTWGVAANEQTWLLRHCQLSGTAHVAQDGSITIDYTVKDRLDLTAQGGRSGAYNNASIVLGAVWHGFLGAEKPQVTGTFTRRV